MVDRLRKASLVSSMHPEYGLEESGLDGSRSIPFSLKIEIVELAKNSDEEVILYPDKEILLLTKRGGSVVEVPSIALTELTKSLPQPERNLALSSINGSEVNFPSMDLYIPGDGGQILVITPPKETPFKPADQVLGAESHDYKVARKQIKEAQAPLVIARHEIENDTNPDREDRWILMENGNTLYVTSPNKLTSNLSDVTSVVEIPLNGKVATGNLETQQRNRVINTLLMEAMARGRVLVQQPGSQSQVDRAKAITNPVSAESYINEIKSKYTDAGYDEHYEQELHTQRNGLEEAMVSVLNPNIGYQEYLAHNQNALEQKRTEFFEKRKGFIDSFANYNGHNCELLDTDETFECVISEIKDGEIVQKISIEDTLGENGERLGMQIVWQDADSNITDKPVDRKFIGPAQKLKSLADIKRRTEVETLDYDTWSKQSISQSALASGYYTLPYGVRKSISLETTGIDELFDIVSVHNTDRTLRDKARNIGQWLERTGDARLDDYKKANGEMNPSILNLEHDYEMAIERELAIQAKRDKLTNQPPDYSAETYMKLLKIDPRNEVGTRQISELIEGVGINTTRYENLDALLADNQSLAKVVGPKFDLEPYQKEIDRLYPEPVTDLDGFTQLLKNLPLTQKEFDAFVHLAKNGDVNLDTLSKSLVLNSTVFWKNQSRSSDAKVSPEQTIDRVLMVADQMDSGKPLQMSIYCALCEATHPFKVAQQNPDISEYYFMKKLVTMNKVASILHEPGIKWTIVNEATLGGDLLGLSEDDVTRFQTEIESYIESIGGSDSIDIVSMQEILKNPLVENLPERTDVYQKIDRESKLKIWEELAKTGVVEGDLDESVLEEILPQGIILYDNLLSSIQKRTVAPRHRVEVFAETFFPGDLGLELTDDQLLSFYGDQFLGKENPFRTEISSEQVQSEIMGKLTNRCNDAAIHFESHMALRPLVRTLAETGLVDMHPVLSENIISATITRKEDRFVFSPVDNGLFPMHGIGVLTPESKVHVVPLYKIISQPERYKILTVGDKIVAALDTPDDLLEQKISEQNTTF